MSDMSEIDNLCNKQIEMLKQEYEILKARYILGELQNMTRREFINELSRIENKISLYEKLKNTSVS